MVFDRFGGSLAVVKHLTVEFDAEHLSEGVSTEQILQV